MKKTAVQIILFLISFISYAESYAAIDSTLPLCIKNQMDSNRLNVTEYEYKGQRWFSLTSEEKESKVSDKMIRTTFYDMHCQLVGYWVRGGIAGLNKLTPDTIEKAKIIIIQTIKFDTVQKKDTNYLPEPVIKIANLLHGISIQEYLYNGEKLYLINVPLTIARRNELLNKGIATIDEPYYNEKGKIIIFYKRALLGMYARAAQWVPASVKQTNVIKVMDGYWYRKNDVFKNKF